MNVVALDGSFREATRSRTQRPDSGNALKQELIDRFTYLAKGSNQKWLWVS